MREGFTLEKAAAVAGLPRETVKSWIKRGFELDQRRRNLAGRCTMVDLLTIVTMGWLTRTGLELRRANEIARECLPLYGEWFRCAQSGGTGPQGPAFVVAAHNPGREGIGLERVADGPALVALLDCKLSRPLVIVPVLALFHEVVDQLADDDLVPLAGERVLEVA